MKLKYNYYVGILTSDSELNDEIQEIHEGIIEDYPELEDKFKVRYFIDEEGDEYNAISRELSLEQIESILEPVFLDNASGKITIGNKLNDILNELEVPMYLSALYHYFLGDDMDDEETFKEAMSFGIRYFALKDAEKDQKIVSEE